MCGSQVLLYASALIFVFYIRNAKSTQLIKSHHMFYSRCFNAVSDRLCSR